MTLTILSVAGAITVGLLVAAVVLCANLCERKHAAVDAYQPTPAPKKRGPLMDGTCSFCGQMGVYLTRERVPNKRYHYCEPMQRIDRMAADLNQPPQEAA